MVSSNQNVSVFRIRDCFLDVCYERCTPGETSLLQIQVGVYHQKPHVLSDVSDTRAGKTRSWQQLNRDSRFARRYYLFFLILQTAQARFTGHIAPVVISCNKKSNGSARAR